MSLFVVIKGWLWLVVTSNGLKGFENVVSSNELKVSENVIDFKWIYVIRNSSSDFQWVEVIWNSSDW